MSRARKAIVIAQGDNVATMIENVEAGEQVATGGSSSDPEVIAAVPIRLGHKIALKAIQKGEDIIKYGEVIGRATDDIGVGEHVHVHNVESLRGRGDLARASK